MSQGTAFPTRLHVHPEKTQIRLRIRAVWSEFSQGTLWVAKDPKRLKADNRRGYAGWSDRWAHIQSCLKCCALGQRLLEIKGTWNTFRGNNSVRRFCPLWKGVNSKRKEFAPFWLGVQYIKQAWQRLSSLAEIAKILPSIPIYEKKQFPTELFCSSINSTLWAGRQQLSDRVIFNRHVPSHL